jgi:hypothetical protein
MIMGSRRWIQRALFVVAWAAFAASLPTPGFWYPSGPSTDWPNPFRMLGWNPVALLVFASFENVFKNPLPASAPTAAAVRLFSFQQTGSFQSWSGWQRSYCLAHGCWGPFFTSVHLCWGGRSAPNRAIYLTITARRQETERRRAGDERFRPTSTLSLCPSVPLSPRQTAPNRALYSIIAN